MRRFIQLSVGAALATAAAACGDRTAVTETGIVPTAGLRFINAVPDTAGSNGLDFRFIDKVENNAQYAIPFRNTVVLSGGIPASTSVEYKAVAAGSRHFRVFLDDPSPAIAQTVLKDSTLNIEANHRYTVLLWGNARGGANPMRLTVIDETYDPGQRIGLRVINATGNPVDVRTYLASAVNTGTLPASATWAALPGMTISSYVAVDTGQYYKFNVQPAGGGTSMGQVSVAVSGTNFTIDPIAPLGVANGTKNSAPVNGCYVGIDCDATPPGRRTSIISAQPARGRAGRSGFGGSRFSTARAPGRRVGHRGRSSVSSGGHRVSGLGGQLEMRASPRFALRSLSSRQRCLPQGAASPSDRSRPVTLSWLRTAATT